MKVRTFRNMALIVMLAAAAGTTALLAQSMPGGPGMHGPGPHGRGMRGMGPGGLGPGEAELRRELFPPELVMRYQSEINLSDEQKKSLVHEMQALQSDLVPLQFDMTEAAGKLRAALAVPHIDEQKAGALADTLMRLEARIKRRHLTLMIRVKNILTTDQQSQLRALRDEERERRREGMQKHGRPGPDEPPPGEPDEPEEGPEGSAF